MEAVDAPTRETLLESCARACGDSYTFRIFRETWQQSGDDLDVFLARLGERFPGASYKRMSESCIEVHYHSCACDLVVNGWVDSPLLCRCSAYNLKYNFEAAWGQPVQVVSVSSILAGEETCVFLVRF